MPKFKVLKRLEIEVGTEVLEPGAFVTMTAKRAKPLIAIRAISPMQPKLGKTTT